MTDRWTERLSEYVDGELTAEETVALEAHLATCGECSTTVAELRLVVARAQALPQFPPSPELWWGIRQAIQPEAGPAVIDLDSRRRSQGPRRFAFTVPQLAAAAVVLMLMSSAGAWLLLRGGSVEPAGMVAGEPVQQGAVLAVSDRAATDIDRAVADLEALLREGRTRLQPQTVATIESNLRIVDEAIAEAREALERDPNSEYLNTYLAESMRRKLLLLRQSTAIIRAAT